MSLSEQLSNKLKEIKDKGDILHQGGYVVNGVLKSSKEHSEINCEDKRLHLLFSIIPLVFKGSERRSIGSYSGKHIVEKFFVSEYISNGEFILVMMCLGYKFKVYKDNINVSFYGSWVDTTNNELKYKFVV
jgi:hypothetical protein